MIIGCIVLFVLPLIHFIPDLLTYSVLLFLKRQCDRTLGGGPLAGYAPSELQQLLAAEGHEAAAGRAAIPPPAP